MGGIMLGRRFAVLSLMVLVCAVNASAQIDCIQWFAHPYMVPAKVAIRKTVSDNIITKYRECRDIAGVTSKVANYWGGLTLGLVVGDFGRCACKGVFSEDVGPVTAYSKRNFEGDSQTFGWDTHLNYRKKDFDLVGNDQISSLKVKAGYKANLCWDEIENEKCRTFGAGNHDFVGDFLHNQVSYIRVWREFDQRQFDQFSNYMEALPMPRFRTSRGSRTALTLLNIQMLATQQGLKGSTGAILNHLEEVDYFYKMVINDDSTAVAELFSSSDTEMTRRIHRIELGLAEPKTPNEDFPVTYEQYWDVSGKNTQSFSITLEDANGQLMRVTYSYRNTTDVSKIDSYLVIKDGLANGNFVSADEQGTIWQGEFKGLSVEKSPTNRARTTLHKKMLQKQRN